MKVLGFMTGTSLDAVDMAVLETDGEAIQGFGPAGERKLHDDVRDLLLETTRQARAWPRGVERPEIFDLADAAIAQTHIAAAESFLAEHGLSPREIDLIGFHGQTVLHEPPTAEREGRTVQLGDAGRVAHRLGIPVAFDFRTADVAAGGQGAPLAPVYHRARAAYDGLAGPLAVLNLGGVGNITLIGGNGELTAFDTGPANGMIDQWVQARTSMRCDQDGNLAKAGRVDQDVVDRYLDQPYFSENGPKSLDRFEFSLQPVEALSLEDGAATLTEFAARAVEIAVRRLPVGPSQLIVCGGGRHNPVLLNSIATWSDLPVTVADGLGWRGDAIEAEAFAYLAARTARDLPISFPGTTGVPRPMTGGRIVRP
ncbi:MAG: anmK [Caulobacteraceae bacterium]|nr:anmK [Caulobacteraceae bacterium]